MAEATLQQVETLRDAIPEPAKDLRVNLSNVFKSEVLSVEQMWGIALASSYYIRDARLRDAVLADARAAGLTEAWLQDAQAAAALMGMNTVYYRFRHLVEKEVYGQKPARLRMQWMLKPLTTKADFELMSMAVAALAGCGMCMKTHEKSIVDHGLTEDHVHEAVRLASVLQGVAVALNM